MKHIKSFILLAITFLVIDTLWIIFIINPLYQAELGNTLRENIFVLPGLLTYLVMTLGIYYFTKESIYKKDTKNSFKKGAVVGFIMYGTYTLTNYAILESWTLFLVITDILWGTFISSFIPGVITYFNKNR